MSSYNYKYIKIGSNTGKSEYKNWTNTSFWQSNIWADILRKTYQAQDIFLCFSDTNAVLLERRTIFRNYTGLYILGVDGNLIHDELLDFIRSNIKNPQDLFLQIEPLSQTDIHGKKAPFRRFIEPTTAILNLETDEEALLGSFAEKGRYNIRLAQKRWITTKWVPSNLQTTNYKLQNVEKNNPSLKIEDWRLKIEKTYLEAFYDLLEETTERDKFSHNSLSYYQHFIETLEAHDAGWLLVAEKDGILHAAGIFVFPVSMPPCERGEELRNENGGFWVEGSGERLQGGTAIYYYWASSSDRDIRRDMATYLLQWEAIREGMKRGCSTYDFLGISEDGTGKLAGVTEFKLRFNPEKVHLPSEVVVAYKPILLKVLQVVSRVRKIFR
jgi:lipid II:glycine glycyltransferase (peptidoglycan interpeptide bridge formation enzyme)